MKKVTKAQEDEKEQLSIESEGENASKKGKRGSKKS